MTKFNAKTVILRAEATSPIIKGKESLGVAKDRLRIITKDQDVEKRTQRLGSISKHSEDGKDVLSNDKNSLVVRPDANIKMQQTEEATFNMYLDVFTASGTTSNKRVETLLVADITLSELKVLEKGFSLGGTFLEGARTAGKNYSPSSTSNSYSERVNYYDLVKSIQISDVVPNADAFGDINLGAGGDTSVSTEHSTIKSDFLLKQEGDVYVNKIPGISNSAWLTLINNM
jgi:hypothetical protein